VSLEALLIGHEDWLHSVTWRPPGAQQAAAAAAAPRRDDLVLLTSSQDRSMMIWTFDGFNRLWVSEAAVGDAGASCLGFYGGRFSPTGKWLVAHGFTGALHLWKQQQQQQQQEEEGGLAPSAAGFGKGAAWLPQHALGGHYGPVVDLSWGADGGCLQSASGDQTARLFTAVRGHWFELARTQVSQR
jgi:elongator complex protein 2